MKADTQTIEDVKPKSNSSGRQSVAKGRKSAGRKSSVARASAKRTAKAATKRSSHQDGLMARGKEALVHVPNWVSSARRGIPKSLRKIQLPDTAPLQNFIDEKPLIIGAVGLGLGAILGVVISSQRRQPKQQANNRRRK